MPCENYKNALTEAAASSADPQGELRAHLAACPACRASFAEEQSLFCSIDTSLRAAANTEVPASFLPRVRARIAEQPAVARSWAPSWLALAGAAAMIVAFITLQAIRRGNSPGKPPETATQASPTVPVLSVPRKENSIAPPSTERNTISQSPATVARNFSSQEILVSRTPEPEVLVPRDQEVFLLLYAEQWNKRKRDSLVAAESDAALLKPLEIAPIQIAQLDVKPLAESQGQ